VPACDSKRAAAVEWLARKLRRVVVEPSDATTRGVCAITTRGGRRRKARFPTKSAALAHYRDVLEPELRGDIAPIPDITLAELVDRYLERHAATVRARTIMELRKRLRYAVTASGDVPLRDLEREPTSHAA
jgi:hypothetical protein